MTLGGLHDPRVQVGKRPLRPIRNNRSGFGRVTSLDDLARILIPLDSLLLRLGAGIRCV
jgi:hypothetical protein